MFKDCNYILYILAFFKYMDIIFATVDSFLLMEDLFEYETCIYAERILAFSFNVRVINFMFYLLMYTRKVYDPTFSSKMVEYGG